MGKKRKAELDLDVERTMYHSFVSAANSISQLYTQAVQQHRKSSTAGARSALERVLCFAVRDYANCEAIPVKALVEFLQHEYESLNGQEALPSPFPVHPFPLAPQGSVQQAGDESSDEQHGKPNRSPLAGCSNFAGSARRASFAGAAGPMEVAEQDRGMSDFSQQPTFSQSVGFLDQADSDRKAFGVHPGFSFS